MITTTANCTICTDKWTWVATYFDGRILDECGPEHHVFADIDQDNLSTLAWEPRDDSLPMVCVQVGPGSLPILFRRRLLTVDFSGAGEPQPPNVVHCVGTIRAVGNETVGSYTFVFENGSVLVSDNLQAV